MDPLPLSILKAERCPRISAEDLIELLDLNRKRFTRPKMVVVDVRSAEKYAIESLTSVFCSVISYFL